MTDDQLGERVSRREQYYTESPSVWGEYPDHIEWGNAHNTVGYGDIDGVDGEVEWITFVTPTYFRQFAELVEYAYGDFDHLDDPMGSVEIGVGYSEEGGLITIVARERNDVSEKGLYCATRVKPGGDQVE